MNCYVKLHPWDVFLKARADIILFFYKQGKTPEEIAITLSMDAEQVSAIMAAYRENNGAFFYGPYGDKERDE